MSSFFSFFIRLYNPHLCTGYPLRFLPLCDKMMLFAGMVELADTLDLGSNGIAVQVQVLLPAPQTDQFVFRRIGLFARSVLWTREEIRRIVKLLHSEVSADVGSTLRFTLCKVQCFTSSLGCKAILHWILVGTAVFG